MSAAGKGGLWRGWSDRVFGGLLVLLYPRSFRAAYAGEMTQVFRDRRRELWRDRGLCGALLFWRRTLGDIFVSGMRVRAQALRDRLGGARHEPAASPGSGPPRHLDRLGSWIQDFQYGFRSLRKSPGFTTAAILTLTLGIGANTAIFSFVNGIILRPLPYADPDRVVRVWPGHPFSKELFDDFREGTRSFEGLSAWSTYELPLTGEGEPEEIVGAEVSVNHFTLLGIQPTLGRSFQDHEEVLGEGKVVILSHSLWQRRFGSDPDVIGTTVNLGIPGEPPYTIVGVMPRGYRPIAGEVEMWAPLTVDPENFPDYSGTARYFVGGRLAEGVSVEEARAEVRGLVSRLVSEYRWIQDSVDSADVILAHEAIVSDIELVLWVLLAAVGCVLLIACTNVANLLLARGSARRRELGIRAALGAGRARLLRQLLAESFLLGALGGVAGLMLAAWTVSALVGLLPRGVPRAEEIGIDLRVLAFTFGISLAASLVFGLLPALRTIRDGSQKALIEGSRAASPGIRRHRLNKGLVVAEVALSVVLVVGAGLMLKSIWRLGNVAPGFEPDGVVTITLSPPGTRYPDGSSLRGYYAQVMDRVATVPGVVSAGGIHLLPMTNQNWGLVYEAEDNIWTDDEMLPRANFRIVTPGYFRTMGIALMRGRDFTDEDVLVNPDPYGANEAAEAIIVNQTMAELLWPDEDPIGKEICIGCRLAEYPGTPVVGVVQDIHQHRLNLEPQPEMYVPYAQVSESRMYLMVRVEGTPTDRVQALKDAIWSVDANVPIPSARPMPEVIRRSYSDPSFYTLMISTFALIALALGAVGVYGVVSYTVSQRTQEIGLRMALGADGTAVRRAVLLGGLGPVFLGVSLGLLGAIAATRVLSSLLFEVTATDPVTFVGVAGFLMLVAAVACYLPARRASRVDPMTALRLE